MTTKKIGQFSLIIFGSFLIEFVILIPSRNIVMAKSQKSVIAQTNGDLGKNRDIATKEAEIETENQEVEQNNKGSINSETHRSVVATFVHSLLDIADREGGIGQQVREIAQQQNDSKEVATGAIDKIEKRSKITTFLIGTDYKNIGVLRSEMVKTRNQIEQLKKLVDKANSKKNSDEIQTQIKNLEQEQADINSFISQNESEFSLFGWVAKLFVN